MQFLYGANPIYSSSLNIGYELDFSQLSNYFASIGVWAGGAAAPPKFGQLRFFGQQEKFGQSQFLKKFAYVCGYHIVQNDHLVGCAG